MNIEKMIEKCHGAAVAGGWWSDTETGEPIERNKGELLCLVHSEISEAVEGIESELMDDHLPHYSMEVVEMADGLIRIFDYSGGFGVSILTLPDDEYMPLCPLGIHYQSGKKQFLCGVHKLISQTMEGARKGVALIESLSLSMVVKSIILYCQILDVDIEEIIHEKLAYNKQRADHKPENREKEGGKKF